MLVAGVATGFEIDFTPPACDVEDVENYVQEEFEQKVTDGFLKELKAGHTVVARREDVGAMTAVGVADKDHSGFKLIRLINDFSRVQH